MTTTTDDSELSQLQEDLIELKEQVKRLKQAEYSYAAESTAFRTNYQRLDKYFKTLPVCKQKSEEGKEIAQVLKEIKRSRPIKPHWLLMILLGNHLTYKLITPADQLAYKKDYEHFKITVTLIHLILSAIGLIFIKKSFVFYDGLIPLYSVIAYWIMIGREAVLKMNGSNIRGWWFAHHLISMILCAVMIIWDKREVASGGYGQVRTCLYLFYLYIGSVQVLQYNYQMNRLYALRSLSRVDPMETTNELSQNLIHHNLLYLLPFLLVAYVAEFYLAHLIWSNRNGPASIAISLLYFTLATGNTLTTCYTYYRKTVGSKKKTSEKKILLVRQFTKSNDDLAEKKGE